MEKNIDLTKKTIERAERLTEVRELAKLSRAQLSNLVDASPSTIAHWENLSGGTQGIPEKKALGLISALKSEGVELTFDWLYDGVGRKPYLLKRTVHPQINHFNNDVKAAQLLAHAKKIEDEFKDSKTIRLQVYDDCMSPQYRIGDIVIGRKIPSDCWTDAEGQASLVMLHDKTLLLREVRAGYGNIYTITGSNLRSKFSKSVVYETEVIDIYQIIVHIQWGAY